MRVTSKIMIITIDILLCPCKVVFLKDILYDSKHYNGTDVYYRN
jgi:hypothetical protein